MIGGDGDTFSERAEMFYQSRPQAIQTVHELHRLYRTLADKYEHLLSKSDLSPVKIAFSDSSNSPESFLPSKDNKTGKCNGRLNSSMEAITCNVESMEDYLASGSGSSSSSFEFHSPLNMLKSNTSGIELADQEDTEVVFFSTQEERERPVTDNMIRRKEEDEPRKVLEENLSKQAELIRMKDEKREKIIGGKNKNRFLTSFISSSVKTSPKGEKKANQPAESKSRFRRFFCFLPKGA